MFCNPDLPLFWPSRFGSNNCGSSSQHLWMGQPHIEGKRKVIVEWWEEHTRPWENGLRLALCVRVWSIMDPRAWRHIGVCSKTDTELSAWEEPCKIPSPPHSMLCLNIVKSERSWNLSLRWWHNPLLFPILWFHILEKKSEKWHFEQFPHRSPF